ncbi:MAG: DUF1178 family protein [Spirochaetota bacterium]
MISFDLECANKHRFEGSFKDYRAFDEQLTKEMIECPVCGDVKIKRLFTGCSIQPGGATAPAETQGCASHDQVSGAHLSYTNKDALPCVSTADKNMPKMSEMIRIVRDYVIHNFENVGKDFAYTAKAMYYGVEEERNIYGESTPQEIKELADEGIDVLPIPSIEKIEN